MTRSITKYFLLSVLGLVLTAAPSLAEDAAPEKTPAAKTEAPAAEAKAADAKDKDSKADAKAAENAEADKNLEEYKQASAKAYDALKDIGANLKEADAKHFYMTYNSYNLIGTVKMVQGDVGNAITECGKDNPDMKADLDGQYKSWSDAIKPVLKEAEGNVNNMIMAQDYAEPAKVKKAFAALDEARKVTNDHLDKKPVTTAKACKHLEDKLGDTQENLISLLRTTLVSFGKTYPEADSAAKTEKAPEKPEEKPETAKTEAPPAEEKKP